ncbi:MAG: hypothetical protein IKA51_00175 [Clostridia bacterium]|nr:hypothetical protein [Clostridia bacterium]
MKFAISSHKRFDRTGILENAKTLWWIPILNLLVMTFLIPITNRTPRFIENITTPGPFDLYNDQIAALFPFVFVILALITAACSFSFLFNKRHQTAMLITGGKRSALFISRYLYGLLSLVLPIIIAMSATVLKVVIISKPDPTIWSDSLEITAAMVSMTFAVYSVSVLVAAIVGRKTEFFSFGIFLTVSTLALFFALNNITVVYLSGANLSHSPDIFGFSINFLTVSDFLLITARYSLLTVFANDFIEFAQFGFSYSSSNPPIPVHSVDLWLVLLLFAIGIAAFFAALFAFCKRNAEIAEKPNACKPLSIAFSVIISFALASVLLLIETNHFIRLLIFTAAFFIFYFLLYGLCSASIYKFWKGFKAPVISVLVIFAIIASMFFGFFGFSSYRPELNEVVKAEVSSVGKDSFAVTLYTNEEISKLLKFHKLAAEEKIPYIRFSYYSNFNLSYHVKITYHLENGKTVTRYYRVSDSSLTTALLAIERDEIIYDTERFDPKRPMLDLPSKREALEALKAGMTYEEIVSAIGKAQGDVGWGTIIYYYKLIGGESMYLHMVNGKLSAISINALYMPL